MKFELQNQFVSSSISFLNRLPLSGYQSIARTRLIKILASKNEEIVEMQKDLIDQYAKKDEDGQLIVKDNNYQFTKENSKKFQEAYQKLMLEDGELEKATYSRHKEDCQDFLLHADVSVSGDEALCYNALCEALDVDFDKR
jgi:hypothetical protein